MIKRTHRTWLTLAALTACALLGGAPLATAGPALQARFSYAIFDGSNNLLTSSNTSNTGTDDSVTISNSGSVGGGLTIGSGTHQGIDNFATAGGIIDTISTSSTQVLNPLGNGDRVVNLVLSVRNYEGPIEALFQSMNGSFIGGAGISSITSTYYVDPGNNLHGFNVGTGAITAPATAVLLGTLTRTSSSTIAPDPFELGPVGSSFAVPVDGLYSMMIQVDLVLQEGTLLVSRGSSLTATQTPVPEPASVVSALAGLGVLGLGAVLRRRKAC